MSSSSERSSTKAQVGVLAFVAGLALGALIFGLRGKQHSVADLRAMDDPREHPCFQVAAESEQNQTDRIYDLVASVCHRYDRSGETELNEACNALLE